MWIQFATIEGVRTETLGESTEIGIVEVGDDLKGTKLKLSP